MVAQLEMAMRRWLLETAGYIKEEKLTGQVLHVVSGNLRSSITATPIVNRGGLLKASLQAGFGNKSIVYARIHELGGVILPKTAAALRFKTADGAWHTVKKVVIPARPYMRPSAEERTPLLVEQLQTAINRYINGPV